MPPLATRLTAYECPRCDKCFLQKSHYRNHIVRKKLCKSKRPSLEDVIPDMENVRVTKAPMRDVETYIDNSTHNDSSAHNDNSARTRLILRFLHLS